MNASVSLPLPMPTPAARCRYQDQQTSLTLREGLEEYRAANPGLFHVDLDLLHQPGRQPSDAEQVDAEQVDGDAPSAGGVFFLNHDLCHVVFGTTTTLMDEGLTDLWTIFGVDVPLREYAAFLKTQEGKAITKSIGWWNFLKVGVLMIPRAFAVWRRCRAMTKPWPWQDYAPYLDRPLSDVREEFGIRLLS